MKSGSDKIHSLDGLRGVLALWVVLGHTAWAAGVDSLLHGSLAAVTSPVRAVEVFIILSGFAIFHLLDAARESYGPFLIRRAFRLYPVYFVCLIVSALMTGLDAAVFAHAPFAGPINTSRVFIAESTKAHIWADMAAHLLNIHSLIPSSFLPAANYAILGQAWSLSLEWQFYIVAPPLFLALKRGGATAAAAMLIACAANLLIAGQEGMLPRYVPLFAIGIASSFIWRARRNDRPKPLGLLYAAASAVLLTHSVAVLIWCVVFAAACMPHAYCAPAISRILTSAPARWLGRLSYSVYLSHSIVLSLAMALLEWLTPDSLDRGPFLILLAILTIAGTLLTSTMLNRFVELPGIAAGHRFVRSPRSGAHAT